MRLCSVEARCHFLAAVPSEFGPYCVSLASNKSVVSRDDNRAVYSEDQRCQGRLFHRPNCRQAWMKMHRLSALFGEVVKVRLQRVDLRARQSCFAVTELLSQLCKMPTELCSLGCQTLDRQFIRSAMLL